MEAADPELALGELFMDGRLLLKAGSIYELLDLIGENIATARPSKWGKLRECMSAALQALPLHNTRVQARRNVAHHYDLDERLYALFLDPD